MNGTYENSSILETIKTNLGIDKMDNCFDDELINHINTMIFLLGQIGVKVSKDFKVTGNSETWKDMMPNVTNDSGFQAASDFLSLKVRKIFDPPTNPSVKEAVNQSIDELTFYLNLQDKHTV